MIKSILVCTDGSPHGDTACDYGFHLGGKLKARVSGLHVLDSRVLEGPLMADISGWLGASPYADQIQQFRDLLEQKGQAVAEAFEKRAVTAGISASCEVKMGHPARIILEQEVHAELVVLGQRGEHAELAGDVAGSVADRVVRHSVKPCLMTPQSFKPVGKILVAYDGSSLASKALHEGIELAMAISAPLVVLAVAEHRDLDVAQEYALAAMRLVRAHECPAAPMVAEGPAGQVIMAKAEETGADLIVVGAFGHTRMRQLVLGSTTSFLMARSTKPVMLVR
jgi:nucleotide-binding universal stress UspA family protein